ncbi:unnamed protein product [Phytophthora fragariaefolia]|uniref:Unnamed protein product n=1 Tax=Phytophthora fragariaefolia TaxID=1490495 RepID=A0A9W6XSN2_9STRA|nr:unnamed protein product [Phytophthora fragariaefolia]
MLTHLTELNFPSTSQVVFAFTLPGTGYALARPTLHQDIEYPKIEVIPDAKIAWPGVCQPSFQPTARGSGKQRKEYTPQGNPRLRSTLACEFRSKEPKIDNSTTANHPKCDPAHRRLHKVRINTITEGRSTPSVSRQLGRRVQEDPATLKFRGTTSSQWCACPDSNQGFHRESPQEDTQSEFGQGNEASTHIGSPTAPLNQVRSAERQSSGRSSTDGTEEGPVMDLEDKPRPPTQVPSGTPAGLDENLDPPDESPPAQAETNTSTQPRSARSTAKKKTSKAKPSRKKIKAPDSETEDRGDLMSDDQLTKAYYKRRELHTFLINDTVMRVLRPKLLGELQGPVSPPAAGSNKPSATKTLMRLLKETGIIAESFEAEALFDLKLSEIKQPVHSLFDILVTLVGEPDQAQKQPTNCNKIDTDTVKERFLKERQMPQTRPKPRSTGDQDVEMESVGSPDQPITTWEYDPDDLDLGRPARATVATTTATTSGQATNTPRIRVSAMPELKEFTGKDGDEDRARREHAEHFIETLDDRDLADQLALLRIPDANTLEEVLRSRQRAKSRQSKTVYGSIKPRQKSPAAAAGTRVVRAVHEPEDSSDSDEESRSSSDEDLRRVVGREDVKLERSPGWNPVRAERSRFCIYAYVEKQSKATVIKVVDNSCDLQKESATVIANLHQTDEYSRSEVKMILDIAQGESRGYWRYHVPDKKFKQAKAVGKINNEKSTLLFESGAEVSILDTAFARKWRDQRRVGDRAANPDGLGDFSGEHKHILTDDAPSTHSAPVDLGDRAVDPGDEEVCIKESGDLYAEAVEGHLAVLPEVTPTTEEVKIEDIQVGNPNDNTQEQKLFQLIKGLLSAKIIQHSTSPWASPVVVIIKKNGIGIRLCIYYRLVNSLTRLMMYPMPLINDLLDDLDKVLWYCSLDMASGFWVVSMTDRVRAISALITAFGLFEWNRMPFGLKNAPQIYQRLLDNALYGFLRITNCQDHQARNAVDQRRQRPIDLFQDGKPDTEKESSVLGRRSYIDDILVTAGSWDMLCERVDKLLDACDEWILSITVSKSFWGLKRVDHLGHRVSAEGIEARPKDLSSLADLPFPTTSRSM